MPSSITSSEYLVLSKGVGATASAGEEIEEDEELDATAPPALGEHWVKNTIAATAPANN